MQRTATKGKLTILAAVLLAVGTACGLCGAYLVNDYRADQASANASLRNLANAGSAYVAQVFAAADLALHAVDVNASVDDVAVGRDPVELHDILRRVQKASLGLQGLGLIDARGRLVGSAQSLAPKPVDLGDREYFGFHRDHAEPGMFIGQPIVSRPYGDVSIPVSRRVSDLQGGFQGILAARLDVRQFERFFATAGADVMAVFRADGVLLARYPPLNVTEAAALPKSSDLLTSAAAQPQGTFLSTSPLDGKARMIAFTTLPGTTPLIVAASYDRAHLTSRWLRRLTPFLIVMAGVVALIAALGWLSHRQAQTDARLIEAQAAARHHAEAATREANDAQLRKTTFLAHMSHEIRTPLNAIIGFSEVIEKQMVGDRPDRYRDYAGDIRFSAQHLLSVINEILDLSKVEAGKWRLQEESFALRALIDAVARLARGRAVQGGVELAVAPPPDLQLRGDERVLCQAILNLVVNAIKYAGADRRVDLRCDRGIEGALTIDIVDRGIGMTAEQAALALRPFEASVDDARAIEGTGLGLPLARGFVELHGGTLALDSAPGKGTRVRVTLPAERVTG